MWPVLGVGLVVALITGLLVLVARLRPDRFRLSASLAKILSFEVEIDSAASNRCEAARITAERSDDLAAATGSARGRG